jgi:sugar lactone lactonase YvrE
MYEITRFSEMRCEAGESPVWDAAEGRLLWADMPAGRIHHKQLEGGAQDFWQLPEPLYSFGLADGGRLVVACNSGVYLYDPATGGRELLVDPEPEQGPGPRSNRLNDGKVGPDGAFWVGSMHVDGPTAALYRVTADGCCETKVTGLITSNGLAFSGDGRTMIHTDSRGKWIDRYAFDPATGAMRERTRIATPDEAAGRPDGGAFDEEGCYWSAGISAGCLNRYDMDGRVIAKIAVPPMAPTMPCFGGPRMRTLFFTSLRHATGAGEHCGHVFMMEMEVAGVPVGRFGTKH